MFTVEQGKKLTVKTLRMPEDIAKEVERIAEENNTTFTSVLLQCIKYALDNMAPSENAEA